jgi:penicillin amidase
MKWLWRILIALLVLIPAGAGVFWLWQRSGVPDAEGSFRLAGLSAPVQIFRDANDVPHVFAASEDDAWFALGFLHAQDRLWQMEMQRRIGAGRLSEVIGTAGLGFDRFMRLVGARRLAEASLGHLSPDLLRALQRYSDGVNAWLDNRTGPLPLEFLALRVDPEPWEPVDSLVWGKLMALQLSSNFREELLRARIVSAIRPEAAADLFPGDVGAPPATFSAETAHAVEQLASALPPPLGPDRASNIWIVSGEATETGAPILANDPHLALDAPALWYLARIETPTLSLAGATVPGVPLVLLGHNGAIAWGLTTTGNDVQDLFIERIDPADPGRYLTPGGSEPFQTREETIAVRGGEPVTLTVRTTRHGPVLSDIDGEAAEVAGDGVVLALAFASLVEDDTTPEALWRLNHARDWPGFLDAMRLWVGPQQNVGYADTAGNIGMIVPGRLPIRATGDGSVPVAGWDGAHDWTAMIPFAELPQTLNPARGHIVNANNAVVEAGYPYFLGNGWDERYRAARIEEAIGEGASRTPEAAARLQMDTLSLDTHDLLPLMLEVRAGSAREAEVLAALRRWSGRMDRDLAEPLVYATWVRALGRALFADELGPVLAEEYRVKPTVIGLALTRRTGWCDDVGTPATETCADILAASLATALDAITATLGEDMAAWRWGAVHRAPLENRVLSRIPLVDRLVDITTETDGGSYTINRGETWSGGSLTSFEHIHGAGLRAVYDLADLARSRFMIATGQSGHPLSPHYGDMTERWQAGETFTISGTPAELAAGGLGLTTLHPAP